MGDEGKAVVWLSADGFAVGGACVRFSSFCFQGILRPTRTSPLHSFPLFVCGQKEGPDTVASRGQVPRSSPRLPPVVAEGGIREAFFSAETIEYLDLRSRNLT